MSQKKGGTPQDIDQIAASFLTQKFQNIRTRVLMASGWQVDYVVYDPELQKDIAIAAKNVTWVENQVARFPDMATPHDQDLLKNLIALHRRGHPCGMLFIITKPETLAFSPAESLDPEFAKLFWECVSSGFWIYCLKGKFTTDGFSSLGGIPLLGRRTK